MVALFRSPHRKAHGSIGLIEVFGFRKTTDSFTAERPEVETMCGLLFDPQKEQKKLDTSTTAGGQDRVVTHCWL